MADLSYLHFIVTRFSFRFKEEDPTEKLLSDQRLTERVAMFEKYCWKSICYQNCPNFYWIIIIDPLLPSKYKLALEELITRHKNSSEYQTRGPREIWLHTWDWEVSTGTKLGQIDWILEYLEKDNPSFKRPRYLITTRLDDDDCLAFNFVLKMKKRIQDQPHVKGFRYYSFSTGCHHYTKFNALKRSDTPMIALGLTLVAEIKKYPICVYLGSHTKIALYIRNPKRHPVFYQLYRRNNEYPENSLLVKRQVQDRLKVLKTMNPVWIRNIHDFNLQKNIGRRYNTKQNLSKNQKILKDHFNVEI